MATDHEQVKALFLAAIERSDLGDRQAFLHDQIGDDDELHERLDALLHAYEQPPSALDRPLATDSRITDATRSFPSPSPGGITDNGPTAGQPTHDGRT